MSTDISRPLQSPTIAEISKALNKLQAKLRPAKKTAENPFFKSQYADLTAVMAAVQDLMAENGLSVTQLTTIGDNGQPELVTTIAHTSGEYLRGYYPIHSVKGDPQSLGSAFTYARRYTLSGALGITAEDDDGNAAAGKNGASAPKTNGDGGVRPRVTQADINRVTDAAKPKARASSNVQPFEDDHLYPFGKHKGTRMADIPMEYWQWVVNNEDFRAKYDQIWAYAAAKVAGAAEDSGEQLDNFDTPPPISWDE